MTYIPSSRCSVRILVILTSIQHFNPPQSYVMNSMELSSLLNPIDTSSNDTPTHFEHGVPRAPPNSPTSTHFEHGVPGAPPNSLTLSMNNTSTHFEHEHGVPGTPPNSPTLSMNNTSTHFEHGVPVETPPNSPTSSHGGPETPPDSPTSSINDTRQRGEQPKNPTKTEAEKRRRLEVARSLSRLQNTLQQVNPDLPSMDSWRKLYNNNIFKAGETTAGKPLIFNKTDVIDSATRLLIRFDAMFTAIIAKRQHLQTLYYQSTGPASQERLSYFLSESLLQPDFIDDMVKCRELIGSKFETMGDCEVSGV
jgi:hypothetical protein